MNTTLDDGGSAFPVAGWESPNHGWIFGNDGMSLRDWMAGMALQGVMVNAQGLGEMAADERAGLLKQVGTLLYEVSDAMIAARKEAK